MRKLAAKAAGHKKLEVRSAGAWKVCSGICRWNRNLQPSRLRQKETVGTRKGKSPLSADATCHQIERISRGGEEGIRTLDTLMRYTPLAGERLRPLGHLSNHDRADKEKPVLNQQQTSRKTSRRSPVHRQASVETIPSEQESRGETRTFGRECMHAKMVPMKDEATEFEVCAFPLRPSNLYQTGRVDGSLQSEKIDKILKLPIQAFVQKALLLIDR